MDANSRSELYAIRKELSAIIQELESIFYGVKNDFVGIGNDKCADCISRVLNQYYYVRRKLNNLDTATVTKSFAQTHGGGGGSW